MQRRQVKHWLKWFGHVPRSSGLAKTILQGTDKEEGADKRSVGRIISLSGQGLGFATP